MSDSMRPSCRRRYRNIVSLRESQDRFDDLTGGNASMSALALNTTIHETAFHMVKEESGIEGNTGLIQP